MVRSKCEYCGALPYNFYSIYIPIEDKNIIWELPKKPVPLNLKIFDDHYIITVCTICYHILGD